MQIPAELTKAEDKIRADLQADATEAATYEKSLVAFAVANKGKVIAIAVIVFIPAFVLGVIVAKIL